MTMIKESNIPELVEDMKNYSNSVKKMSPEEAKKFLIRAGVLDANGVAKKQICGGSNYAG